LRGWATTAPGTCTCIETETLVVKWDLDNWQPMKGRASARVRRLLSELVEEGRL